MSDEVLFCMKCRGQNPPGWGTCHLCGEPNPNTNLNPLPRSTKPPNSNPNSSPNSNPLPPSAKPPNPSPNSNSNSKSKSKPWTCKYCYSEGNDPRTEVCVTCQINNAWPEAEVRAYQESILKQQTTTTPKPAGSSSSASSNNAPPKPAAGQLWVCKFCTSPNSSCTHPTVCAVCETDNTYTRAQMEAYMKELFNTPSTNPAPVPIPAPAPVTPAPAPASSAAVVPNRRASGSWECGTCRFHNLAHEPVCGDCGSSKASAQPPPSTLSFANTTTTTSPPPKPTCPWQCRFCNSNNPASTTVCPTCEQAKQQLQAELFRNSQQLQLQLRLQPWKCACCGYDNGATVEGGSDRCAQCQLPQSATPAEVQAHMQRRQQLRARAFTMRQKGRITEDQLSQINQVLRQVAPSSRRRVVAPQQQHQAAAAAVPEAFEISPEKEELVTRHSFDSKTKQWRVEYNVPVLLESTHFDEGNMRATIKMLDLTRPAGSRACVAKYIKDHLFYKLPDPFQIHKTDAEMQAYCQLIARAYNSRRPPKEVSFLPAWVVVRNKPGLKPHMRILSCEPYLDPAEYVKHNDNDGFVHALSRNTPQAFSHFSFEFTGGRLMVVDIQGVGDVYTDPQIHSSMDMGFGLGNIGPEGMERFYSSHYCNAICKQLGLKNNRGFYKDGGTVLKATAFTAPPAVEAFSLDTFLPEIRPRHNSLKEEQLAFLGMSKEEFNQFVDRFNAVDADHDGKLNVSEVFQIMVPNLRQNEDVEYLFKLFGEGVEHVSFRDLLLWYKGCK